MDENMLSGKTQEDPVFDRKPLLAVNFKGWARIKDESKYIDDLISEFIPRLNKKTEELAEEIRREVRNNLPPGLDVKLDISFSQGSVNWEGVATVLDVMGKIVDGLDFTKLAISVIRFSINKILRREIGSNYPVTKLDTEVNKRKIKDSEYPGTRFLWWCSGTTKDILRDSSFTEKAKYVGMGGVILTTGLLASTSGGYAMYTVFESNPNAVLIGLLFGAIWGLIIFNLDRYIVSSMKKERGDSRLQALRKELGPALPRFLIAILLGITISVPLELRLFKPEIDSQMKFNEDDKMRRKSDELDRRYTTRMDDLNKHLHSINEDIASKVQLSNNLREAFFQEMDRRGGTRIYGYGTVAKKKEAEFNKVDEERKKDTAKLEEAGNQLQNEINEINNQKKDALDAYKKTLGQGILERMTALSDLSQLRWSVFNANLLILLLLTFFEVAPVLVKLLARFGPYDAKLDLREEAEVKHAEFKKKSVVDIAENHYTHLTRSEKQIEEAFFNRSIGVREQEIDNEFQRWIRVRISGQPLSFEEFFESVKDTLYLNRN